VIILAALVLCGVVALCYATVNWISGDGPRIYPPNAISRYDSTGTMLCLTMIDSLTMEGRIDTALYYIEFKYLVVLAPGNSLLASGGEIRRTVKVGSLLIDSLQVSVMRIGESDWQTYPYSTDAYVVDVGQLMKKDWPIK
jgi:hypothetical protein